MWSGSLFKREQGRLDDLFQNNNLEQLMYFRKYFLNQMINFVGKPYAHNKREDCFIWNYILYKKYISSDTPEISRENIEAKQYIIAT